jgi:hypothetical protein
MNRFYVALAVATLALIFNNYNNYSNAQSMTVCIGYTLCPTRCDICLECAYPPSVWANKNCKVSGASESAKYTIIKTHSEQTCTNPRVCEGACDLEEYKITCR